MDSIGIVKGRDVFISDWMFWGFFLHYENAISLEEPGLGLIMDYMCV